MKAKMSITLVLFITLLASSCNGSCNTNEIQKSQTNANGSNTGNLLTQTSAEKFTSEPAIINTPASSVEEEIKNANKAGKAVFLIVTDHGVVNTAKAETIAQQAQKLNSKSTFIQMNRSDAANNELVAKYRLAGAPLPLILVIASNGIVTGGYVLNQATPERLIALIPSPKKEEVLLAINQGKSVFIVISKKSMLKKKEVISKCELACIEMNGKAEVVEIDLDDTKEKRFLAELKVNQTAAQPQTYVINAQGQLTGSLNGVVDTKTLAATATKKVSGGCCPPGSKKSCGPPKKK